MSKKFAAFDIDGTIVRSGLYREIVYDLMLEDKAPPQMYEDFKDYESIWRVRKHKNAFNEFESAMVTSLNRLLPEIRCSDFDDSVERVFNKLSEQVYAYTRDLAKKLKREGYFIIAISGSQAEIVEMFAQKYNFDAWIGQAYERGDDGFFTGKITTTHDGKDKILQELVKKHDLTFEDSVAVGDSRGDIGMLSIVQNPIAFNPEKKLFDQAKKMGWRVVVERKNVIYNLEPGENAFILE